MLSSLPTHVYGIPLWGILFGATALILFFLKMTGETTTQDRYPTMRLFLYIGTIFVAIAGVADFIRWADLW